MSVEEFPRCSLGSKVHLYTICLTSEDYYRIRGEIRKSRYSKPTITNEY